MAKKDRTFVRGVTSETYSLNQFRRAQLAAQREQWKAVDGTLRGIWMEACTV